MILMKESVLSLKITTTQHWFSSFKLPACSKNIL